MRTNRLENVITESMKMNAKCGIHLRHTSRKFLAAVDKIRNMGHPGTFRNILGHRTIRIIMRKMSKIRALGIFFPRQLRHVALQRSIFQHKLGPF